MGKLSAVSSSQEESITNSSFTLTNWWKKIVKVRKVRASLCDDMDAIHNVSKYLYSISTAIDFQTAQDIITRTDFVNSLSSFLGKLPRDPTLKSRNKQARSVRIISSAILICCFPGDILQDEGVLDHTTEAVRCRSAAQILVFTMKRLLNALQSNMNCIKFR
jgi:hypothetical protein